MKNPGQHLLFASGRDGIGSLKLSVMHGKTPDVVIDKMLRKFMFFENPTQMTDDLSSDDLILTPTTAYHIKHHF